MKVPRKTLERELIGQGHDLIIGVDEVGMACLAGPVTVCALAVPPAFYDARYRALAGLRDSKLMQPRHRERMAAELMTIPGLRWHIASCEPAKIDEVNIYQASRIAMREAIQKVVATHYNLHPIVLVDGNKLIAGIALPQQAIVKGDRKVWAIAAASVLAKVHRDRMMADYARRYPGYGFEVHKGYPTAFHRAQLAARGPCPLHRRSFSLE